MTTQIIQIKSHDIFANCLNVTSSDYLTYLGTMPAGCYISSYEKTDGDPKPTLDIGNNRINFSASGKIWNILIKNSSNADLYFLYCCEGSGNDSLNRTVHNGLANNYTDHFLVNLATKWSACYRDDVYRFGYSTKTNLGITGNLVTNGTFNTNVTGWTTFDNTTITRDTVIYPSGGAKISRAVTSLYTGGAYQVISAKNIFRTYISVNIYTVAGIFGWLFLGCNNYGYTDVSNYYNIEYILGYSSGSYFTGDGKYYVSKSNVYLTLAYNSYGAGYNFYFDNVIANIYEDDIKIPTLLINRTKDCLGNTKTN